MSVARIPCSQTLYPCRLSRKESQAFIHSLFFTVFRFDSFPHDAEFVDSTVHLIIPVMGFMVSRVRNNAWFQFLKFTLCPPQISQDSFATSSIVVCYICGRVSQWDARDGFRSEIFAFCPISLSYRNPREWMTCVSLPSCIILVGLTHTFLSS